MSLKSFLDAKYSNKRVLLRVDYNVPLDGKKITDDNRIRESLPTIQKLLDANCRIIIMSHLGRPEGHAHTSMSLKPVAARLQKLLKRKVYFIKRYLAPKMESLTKNLKPGQIVMLENLRFHSEEESNDQGFAEKLSKLGDIYIDDAFACAHRAHASIHAITRYLPSYAGLLLQKEIENLSPLLHHLEYPVTMVIGGAKIDTKIDLLTSFAGKVDHFIMGGGIANTFLAAKQYSLGASLVEQDKISVAKDIELLIRRKNHNVHLPEDYIVAGHPGNFVLTSHLKDKKIPAKKRILDIGPQSAKEFARIIEQSKTIIWNGPMGVCEFKPFRKGTLLIGQAIAKATRSGARSVLGGGDTVDAIKTLKLSKELFTHVSTGGGAMLEFLVNGTLPGLEVLQN
jgi:phosphoglycerate kinase